VIRGAPQPAPRCATLNEALARAAASEHGITFADEVRGVEREQFFAYRELHQRARRSAGYLAHRGVRPGDRVVLAIPTAVEFLDAFFGALLAGAVPVPVYPPVRLGRLTEYHAATARMISAVEARAVVATGRVRSLLGQAVERSAPPLGCLPAEELATFDGAVEREVLPGALGLIQFSSGSTVDPKPVALTHAALLAQLASLDLLLDSGGRQLGVSWLPLYHDMGLIGCLLLALYHPGSLVLLPPEQFLVRPALWLRAISRHRATHSTAPNFAYGLCLKRIRDEELAGLDLRSWRIALNGAEPVSPALLRRFAERFAPCGLDPRALLPVYGLSESALAVTFSGVGGGARGLKIDPALLARAGEVEEALDGRELASVGTPVPGAEVEIRDPRGRSLPESRVGRIFTRSASLMREYFNAPEASRRALASDGWLDTGDLGFIRGGELYVCGRAKDLVIIRGANHAPQEFEDCLEGFSQLRAGCAVALGFLPDGEESEELLLLAERRAEVEVDRAGLTEELRAAVLGRTGVRAHTVVVLEPGTLPRTSSGKLRRQEALRRFQAGELSAPRPVHMLSLAGEVAKSALAFARAKRGSG
jgi:fatty-acyl-CoA synthase